MMPYLIPSLELIGGEPFPANSVWSYWSSTEVGDIYRGYAWLLDYKGIMNYNYKLYDNYAFYDNEYIYYYLRIRSIRDF
jgi:hypothetical protein